MRCAGCPVRGEIACHAEPHPGLCADVAVSEQVRGHVVAVSEHNARVGTRPPGGPPEKPPAELAPGVPLSEGRPWVARVNLCLYRDCAVGCQRSKCHWKGRLVTLAECVECLAAPPTRDPTMSFWRGGS